MRNMSKSNSGYYAETKSGKKGRTYHSKQMINGKVPVYIETERHVYSPTAVLCDPATLKIIGFID